MSEEVVLGCMVGMRGRQFATMEQYKKSEFDTSLLSELKEFIPTRPRGLPYPPATLEDVQAAEHSLGYPLPALLRALLLEIGNGGFGPSGGTIFGVSGGWESDSWNIVGIAKMKDQPKKWPRRLVALCDWGCAQISWVNCMKKDAIYYSDQGQLRPMYHSIDEFFRLWMKGEDVMYFSGLIDET